MRMSYDYVFFSQKGEFLTGLLPEVTTELRKLGYSFTREDIRQQDPLFHFESEVDSHIFLNRPDDVDETDESDLKVENNNDIILRDYQVDVVNAALKAKRGIIKCATGGGKTFIMTAIIKEIFEHFYTFHAIILVRTKTLIDQIYQTFLSVGFTDVGRVSGDYFEIKKVIICTIQSLDKIKSLIPETKVLMIDEVHEFSSTQSVKSLNLFSSAVYRLGFSATPWKEDKVHNYRLIGAFGPELCDVDVSLLQTSGVLSPCYARFYPVVLNDMIDHDYFEAEEFGLAKNDVFHKMVAKIVESIPSGRIMVMVNRLAHGDALHQLIPGSYWIAGEDSLETQQFVYSLLRDSPADKKVVAIVSRIGSTGINVFVHHLINASGGKSTLQLIQKIGRGLRLAHDKKVLQYHDFAFIGNKYLAKHSRRRKLTLEQQGHTLDPSCDHVFSELSRWQKMQSDLKNSDK
eukprot:TRINITY_DN192_c0_g1_i3.p1 TRINITY_DN192_c0_g1~~TRINITY_DN192_c0_g1_i3.p1  ORF type:complete len:511 (+),score=26.55 TRINITY_DN192_c0_g1_i3:157-1533(+)